MKKWLQPTLVMFSALCALASLMLPFNSTFAATLPKKAIYVLPGYMGSQLFLESGTPLWLGPAIALDILTPLHSPLANHADGTGMRAKEGSTQRADSTFDEYGVLNVYETLVNGLRGAFDKNHGGTGAYEVIFFPYNWLGDLNESAAKLETHINQNGYSSVVLIGHSTGGLLAACYMARGNTPPKVEKAIFIATPFYGSYSALEALEFGTQVQAQNALTDIIKGGFLQGSILGGLAKTVVEAYYKTYVRTMVRNSPTTYQLLPSDEYLSATPVQTTFVEFRWEKLKRVPYETLSSHNSAEGFYAVLNNSAYTKRINTRLVNGNTTRSHQYFREVALGNNISGMLSSIGADNVLLIGNKGGNSVTGFLTPTSAHYTSRGVLCLNCDEALDIVYSYDGDGVVSAFSAALPGFRFSNYAGIAHLELAKDSRVVLQIIAEII